MTRRVVSRVATAVLLGSASILGGCATGDPIHTDDPALAGSTGAAATSTTTNATDDSLPSNPMPSGVASDEAGTTVQMGTSGCDLQPWFRDADDDGFGDPRDVTEACEAPDGYVGDDTDCDDDDPQVYPGAPEPCGGPDRDCDGEPPELCSSCAELLDGGNGTTSDLYTIDVDGPGGSLPSTQVWCDQETDGGGWTLVQRTVWDPAQTNALRTDYSTWHSQTIGNPNPGQGFRLQGAAWSYLNGQLDHLLVHRIRQSDGEACDPLYYVGSGGELTIDAATALLTTISADAQFINGNELSTTDSGPSLNCVNNNQGVPWFYGSCCATCPVYQGGYWNEPHPMANYVHTVGDVYGNTEADVCAVEPEMAINGSTYRGIDAMEYYLR